MIETDKLQAPRLISPQTSDRKEDAVERALRPKRLAEYVAKGGTLVVADAHLTGPGVAELGLPKTGDTKEADSVQWLLKSNDRVAGVESSSLQSIARSAGGGEAPTPAIRLLAHR